MLLSLTLTDFVLVEQLSLDFTSGFSVLTGETGAGKSILIDALSMVLGERTDSSVIREGASRAEVSAEFAIGEHAQLRRWLEANDLAADEDVLLLRRAIDSGGRSRGFINGRPATAQQLRQVGDSLIDIHGQHAHYSLLKAAEQRRLLDAFADAETLAGTLAGQFRDWQQASERRRQAERLGAEAASERERWGQTASEIEALAFSAEGWQSLQDEHRRLVHAAELMQGAQAVAELIESEETGVLVRLKLARQRLHELAAIDSGLDRDLAEVTACDESLREVARQLDRYAERVDLDAERLAEAEARLAAVQSLARKYRLRPDDLPELLAEAHARLAELAGSADVEALAAAESLAEKAYRQTAGQLSNLRLDAAGRLAKAVEKGMQRLAMQGGRFEVHLQAIEPCASGLESVEFLVSPNPGQGLKPLAGTASGGELSRIGLALQTVLSGVSGAATLIFDEVDAGIGGGVAEVVGHLLSDLGRSRQVLCVTHLPQVAARAAGHYRVSKVNHRGSVQSQVDPLQGPARVDELARMLGGVKITAATRAHAAEMLGLQGAT
jgi:DNA repair protein RecN (Recombination protein N)